MTPRRTRLRGRLLLALVVAFLPLLALETYFLDAQANILRDRILSERQALARSEAQAADTYIAGGIRALETLALAPAIRILSRGELDPLLRSVTEKDPLWLTVALSGADGFNISALTTAARSVNISDRDYFQGALAGRPTVGTALLVRSTGAKSLVVAVPVTLVDGSKAVLSGALSLTNLEAQLKRSLGPGIDLIVVDRRAQQFVGPGIGETFPVLTGRFAIDAALRGEEGATVTAIDGAETVVGYAGAPVAGWGVVLREPAAIAFAEIDRQRGVALTLSGAATVTALLLAIYLGSRLERTYDAVARAREDATRERDRLQRIVDELPVAVTIYDGEGRRLLRNATYVRLVGEAPPALDDVRARFQMRYEDGRAVSSDELPGRRALRGETVRGEQHVLHNPTTGGDVHVLADAVPMREGTEVRGALVVFQDITDMKNVERERSAFFDLASHEIKTPLTALLGHVQLAKRRAQEGAFDRAVELLGRAEQGGRRLADLVRDLLDVSRLDSGHLDLTAEPVELDALVAGVVEEVAVTSERHQIVLQRDAAPLVVSADPRRLTQVVQNLLDNAVRYSPDGGRIDVTVRREGADAVVRVTDRGVGVPEDERAMLFQRFFRTTRTQSLGGTGLGLFISRRIAELHGGKVWLDRSGPDGSVFAFSMPLASPPTDDDPGAGVARDRAVSGG